MSQLSEQEKKKKKLSAADIHYHEQKIGEIEQEFIAFQNELNNKQERVREWAERLEALKEKLGIETNEVCAFISKRLDDLNVNITDRWVRESLDSKYKRGYSTPEQIGTTSESSTNVELPNISKIVDNAGLEQGYEQANKVEAYARDLARLARDAKAELEEKADKNHFQLPNTKAESVRTQTPDEMEGAFYRFLIELANGYLDLAEKVKKFPPDAKDDRLFSKALEPYIEQIRYATDEKFTKGVRGWTETIATMAAGHKHEAAVIHKSTAKIKVKKYDEEGNETEQWIEVPRNMTREQVGDKEEAVLELAIAIINSQPLNEVIEDWHDKYAEPYIAGRKVDLHETLSDKA